MADGLVPIIVPREPDKAGNGSRGRPPKYTRKSLEAAVCGYFDDISYDVELCGADRLPIMSNGGKPIMQTLYAVPPTVAGLCRSLGINRVTWERYCDAELHPEYEEITGYASTRFEQYLNEQLLTREKPQGVIFNLQNNYGWTNSEKREVELGEKTRSAVRAGEISLDEKLAMIASASRDLAEAGYAAAETEADDSG